MTHDTATESHSSCGRFLLQLNIIIFHSTKMFTPHDTSVGGTVAPGLERVKEVFQRNFRSGDEISAQLCVVHRGDIVTNLKQAMQSNNSYRPRLWTCGARCVTLIIMETPCRPSGAPPRTWRRWRWLVWWTGGCWPTLTWSPNTGRSMTGASRGSTRWAVDIYIDNYLDIVIDI